MMTCASPDRLAITLARLVFVPPHTIRTLAIR